MAPQVVRRHAGKIECLARALLAYGTLVEEDAIRGVAGLRSAYVEVGYWTMQFADTEALQAGSIVAR